MQTLDDVVRDTVKQFVTNGTPFTGLDVSNSVKLTLPFARHSEVSELVRLSFVSEMEPNGYAKTPINVTLKDGSTRTAMLYHALADAWDLDNAYAASKRAQVAAKPTAAPASVSVSANGTVTVSAPKGLTVSAPAVTVAPSPVPPAQAWAQMFNSTPSLFPLK